MMDMFLLKFYFIHVPNISLTQEIFISKTFTVTIKKMCYIFIKFGTMKQCTEEPLIEGPLNII